MDEQNLGTTIRAWLRGLLGSRLNAHLEEELLRLRADYETRLLERERVIADLREQNGQLSAKVDRYELVLLPLASPLGGFFTPKKETKTFQPNTEPSQQSWQEIQADWEKTQEEEMQLEKAARENK